MEAARAIGTGRVGGGASMRQNVQPQQQQQQLQQQQLQQQQLQQQQLQQQQQQFISSPPPALMDLSLNAHAPALINYPVIDHFKPQQPPSPQSAIQAEPTPKPMTNIINGVPFKLPSVQDRLIKNRLFFDENLKTVAQTGNTNSVAGNQ